MVYKIATLALNLIRCAEHLLAGTLGIHLILVYYLVEFFDSLGLAILFSDMTSH